MNTIARPLPDYLTDSEIERNVTAALSEDIGGGDLGFWIAPQLGVERNRHGRDVALPYCYFAAKPKQQLPNTACFLASWTCKDAN